jgi:hypothetical protein
VKTNHERQGRINVNLKEVNGWIRESKMHPFKTALVFLVLSLLFIGSYYLQGYFQQTGKRHAIPTQNEIKDLPVASREPQTTINQQTQGDHSPAIVSNGGVTMNIESKQK